jgi:thiamine-phosphate pyrophosphorylase
MIRRMTLADTARRLKATAVPRPILVPTLILITDETRLPDPLPAIAALPRGAGVLLRHYGAAGRAELAVAAARLVRHRGLVLMVAGDWRLAARLGAAGLHLPEGQARHGVLAPLLGWVRRRKLLLTVACHSPAALARAKRLGADAAILSPVFATRSHPGAVTIGALRFRRWARAAGLPVAALGGIDARTLRRLNGAAAAAAAVGALS